MVVEEWKSGTQFNIWEASPRTDTCHPSLWLGIFFHPSYHPLTNQGSSLTRDDGCIYWTHFPLTNSLQSMLQFQSKGHHGYLSTHREDGYSGQIAGWVGQF